MKRRVSSGTLGNVRTYRNHQTLWTTDYRQGTVRSPSSVKLPEGSGFVSFAISQGSVRSLFNRTRLSLTMSLPSPSGRQYKIAIAGLLPSETCSVFTEK